jgi:PHD/YefM family antitoxin component YafN of YafNO toxin-antitoxin module
MKEVTVEELVKDPKSLLDIAQSERIVVTRKGKPSVVMLGLEFKDEEDYALERDTAFWQMIRERRREKTVPLAEVERRLGISAKAKGKKPPQ